MEIWHPKYRDQAFSDENFVSLSENEHKNEENTY
jgi:hypothetical protein